MINSSSTSLCVNLEKGTNNDKRFRIAFAIVVVTFRNTRKAHRFHSFMVT